MRMELALGTVQFGLVYGLSGGTQLLPDEDVREILEFAFERGITFLDTAPTYGDVESRLGQLCDGLDFRIISKIPPVPEGLDNHAAGEWVIASAEFSRVRLGNKLRALLFHRTEDLIGVRGAVIWKAIIEWGDAANVAIGASGYDADEMRRLFEKYHMAIGQLPGNALDQRISGMLAHLNSAPELHLRSAFLQGLLLLPLEDAVKLLPRASAALRKWQQWLGRRGLSPLKGALSVVKSFREVTVCVVGVDNISQLEELIETWHVVGPISEPGLACNDLRLIDPRQWSRLD
jgi:aryl-alcohol dehydrogenase-like predicted oxidoreductase